MTPQEKIALARATELADAGHTTAAIKLVKPLAKDGTPEMRFALIELYFVNYMMREAAMMCRELLEIEPGHALAQMRLCEALLLMGLARDSCAALPAAPPPGEEMRWTALSVRVRFADLRQRGAEMWAAGKFDDGKAYYEQMHIEEEAFRAEFRAILDASPDNQAVWDLLVDMVGNYRISYAMNQALPDREALCDAYVETITGRADHPARQHRHVVAATFRSLREPWPNPAEVVGTIPATPRHYQPARFGGEVQTLQPVEVAPRQVVRLREAMVYDAGIYMMICGADGNAPWLLEGVWGKHIARHIPAVIPGQQCFFEGVGMGTTVCTLPAPARRIEEPVVAIAYWNNYGHFLHDVLPQLQDAETVLGRDFKILATDAILPSIRDALARCGYGADRIITVGERQTAILREVYCLTPRSSLEQIRVFSTPMSYPFWHYDMALDDGGVRFVRDRLLPAKQAPATRKIYTSRRKTQRKPFNEAAIEAMLAAQGFEILVPDEMSLEEQIALFNATDVLVALEGASLANTIFMQPGAKVMVLRSLVWGWTVNCFDELARINKLDLQIFDFEGRNVPVDALRAQLAGWLARAA